MRRCLVTGGAGFVGSSLCLRLRAAWPAAEIVALDNLYRKGAELNVDRLRRAGVTVRVGDVRHTQDLDAAGPSDVIIDAAAEPSVLAGRAGDVRYVVDTNLGGTLNVLECARRWSARIIFLSTSRVYPIDALRAIRTETRETRFEIHPDQSLPGVSPRGIDERFPMAGARTLYGATKYASEVMVQEYASQFGVRAVINRCGVIAGPWQMGRVDQGIVALWLARHLYGLPLTYIGYGGKQVRDALHIEDLADLIEAQLTSAAPLAGQVLPVGGGRAVSFSLIELTELASRATGRSLSIASDDRVREGDIPVFLTDAGLADRTFGWKPARSLEQIIDDTARWLRDNRDALRPVFGA